MKTQLVKIWRWDAAGYWMYVRDCYREDKDNWLRVLRMGEPGAVYRAVNRRPVKAPTI